MLRIDCPFCGPRPETEFVCGGDATQVRPAPDADDAEWARYLHFPANPKGPQTERWVHALGCGQWFLVERDTVTHAIASTAPLPGVAPGADA